MNADVLTFDVSLNLSNNVSGVISTPFAYVLPSISMYMRKVKPTYFLACNLVKPQDESTTIAYFI
ncbi:hypothetical protein [Mycoplasmopsis felifaucium]|uniref:hypothetical protein n=1 Tax=Mycoplasmopsis felifaucium TaxID=35768 RepID=UPI000B304453|nr:hypothetical protein [Mycoplasmopsis felifaucium]